MAEIFVSYAREDQDRVEKLVAALEEQGLAVFWDRNIPSGQTWRSYIGKSLDEARCVLVAWSQHSVNSSWVIEEADDGKRRGILIPVLLDSVEQPRGFREIQAADLTDWQPGEPSSRFDRLVKDIRTMLHGSPRGASRTPVAASAPRTDARTDGNTPGDAKISGKHMVFALAVSVLVITVIVVGYLGFTRKSEDSRVARRRPAQALISESDLQERKVKARPEPSAAVNKSGVTKQPGNDPSPVFALRAVIKDPDGYTNVRRMKSASSEIVTKVFDGEEFYTHAQDGVWWQVKTKDGNVGYMHVSRIRVLK